MRRLPILAERAADAPGRSDSTPDDAGEEPVLAGGPLVVLVPLDEAATIAFASELARDLSARGVRPTIVLESAAELTEPPAWLGSLVSVGTAWTWTPPLATATRAHWARALAGPGAFIVIGESAAANVRSGLVVAIGQGASVALSPRFRRIRASLDAVLEDARPGFAGWLAGRMCVQGGPFVR